MAIMIENINSQTITPALGNNPRQLYEHQIEAIQKLDMINKKESFHTLLVLPTGGGKTLTAAYWLLKNAVDKGKKILWIAHRHLLLEQAAEAFSLNAYTSDMINRTVFNYRIISGMHDKPINIKKNDSIIIAGKDSLIRSLDKLDKWINNEDIYFVIDEAHHAVAKSYKRIISYVEEHAKSVKLLGLTATPFRTSENEKGALKQIFTDDIVYKTDLNILINKGILSYPHFDSQSTNLKIGDQLGVKAMRMIENFDDIPEDIKKFIALNGERNNFIVSTYFDNYMKYGQTIVFALNKVHAMSLCELFNERGKKYGVKADFIISDVRDEARGITVSNKDNEEKIEKYRNGELQVLVNVNILTEGTDLPKTRTVFLTRPTVSTVLMTQMVGRALRGEKAGGTKEAYIVSFIDDWNNKIAWVNPQTLTEAEYSEQETKAQSREHNIQLISISKIEEFALMVDSTVDTSKLDSIEVIERIPLGMYTLSTFEWNHQILIYNSTESAYKSLIADLSNIMEYYEIEGETIPDNKLEEMCLYCKSVYFNDNMIPAVQFKDIEYLLKFYAQKEVEPLFITLDEIDRKKLDVTDIAENIYNADMRPSEKKEYINNLWESEESIIKIFYNNEYFFKKMIDIELDKLDGYINISYSKPQTEAEMRELEKFTLQHIIDHYPQIGIKLRDNVYKKAKNNNGQYICAECGQEFGTRQYLHIDHIVPISKGGLTVENNLQVLCRSCNMKKSDK